MGILVVLMIVVSGLVNYYSAKKSLFKRYGEIEFPLVILNSAQSDLQAILEKGIETSELLADDPTLLSWFEDEETDPMLEDLSLKKLDYIHKSYGYSTVFAVSAATFNYWSEDFTKIDVISPDDKDDSWFFYAIGKNEKTAFNFDHNNELDRTILFVNVLMEKDNKVLGIAGVGLDPSILIDKFEEQKPSPRSKLWLVDKAGKVIMSSKRDDIGFSLTKHLPLSVLSVLLSDINEGVVAENWNEEKELELAFMRLSDTEYKLVMLTPKEDLFPVLKKMRRLSWWFSIVFLVVTLLVTGVWIRKITNPILRLHQYSQRMAKGDLEVKIDKKLIERNDEIGLLSNAFESMKSQLSLYIERINKTNDALNIEKEQLKIANEQLSEAIHKASESERLTQSFLANISHEIRTPMNSILGFSQLLEYSELESEENKLYASHVVRGGQQLLTTLDSIINLSKIESGVVKPVFEPIDITTMLTDTYDLYKVLANQKEIEMHLEIDEQLKGSTMVSDIALFQLVLNNLVSNAVKYTESGFVNLGYKLDKEQIVYHICDSGIGIAKKDIEAVFKPFRQVSFNHSETKGGAGLGLAIVSKVLHILGGTVEVCSVLGEGSTFYVRMPLNC